MNQEEAGFMEPAAIPEEPMPSPFPEQARQIEQDMFNIMTHQLRIAIIQVVLATVSILAALLLALIR
jgi:uncharacterized protein YjeT (DUF2065 family)